VFIRRSNVNMQRSFSSSYVDRSSTATCRQTRANHTNDYDRSHYRTCLQRASSASSCSSACSNASANYRILPVRYSSVDRHLPQITSNEHGINVRICFDRPHHHRHHRKNKNQYHSSSMLDPNQSNITYIETRSIVRSDSNDNLPKTSVKSLYAPNSLASRAIREDEE